MATEDSLKKDNEQFGDAFNEAPAAATEQSEDEAFGLNLPATDAGAEGDGETDGGVVATQAGDEGEGATTDTATNEPAAESTPVEPPADAGDEAMPEMTQSEKSWEGRLRKREEELKALAAELDARKSELAEPAKEEAGETPAQEAAEGDAVTDISPEDAIAKLTEDFGPEFVSMICAIAGKSAADVAGEKVGDIAGKLDEFVDNVKSIHATRHMKEILKAHPDFAEVGNSDEFKAWVSALPADQQADAMRVIESGDSDEINDLLTQFKSANAAGAETSSGGADEQSIDSAEGVRSTGLRLPDAPEAGKDDFAAAWDEHK